MIIASMSEYLKNTDLELLELLRSGDQAAFSEIFERYNRLLYINACKLIEDKEEARDVVQEIFIGLWENRSRIYVKSNFAGFLYTVTRNRIFDRLSHKKVEFKYLENAKKFNAVQIEGTDELLRTRQLQELIEREISFLPPKMRAIFEMSRKQLLSHKEIAGMLSVSEKTVKNQVNNVLKILRTKLGAILFLYTIL